jgi:gamma-glutamylcyclotransferase (GGCT)/AIG2-like uncharacterized protein YtfP
MLEHLFVYGTLRPGHAPAEIADAVSRLVPLGPGTIRGRRYDLGAYPGVVLDADAGGEVLGEVFLVPDEATFAQLDSYEDCRPSDPEASLFLRVRANVAMHHGTSELCWVYVYNGPVPVDHE